MPLASFASDSTGASPHDASGSSPRDYDAVYADLVSLQTPVKNQGNRDLCTVFATTALMEYQARLAGEQAPSYSEQYLYWLVQTEFTKELGNATDTGFSRLAANLPAVHQVGVVDTAVWPYEAAVWSPPSHPECVGPQRPVPCFTDGSPPQEADASPKHLLLNPTHGIHLADIKPWLATKRSPVIVSVKVFCQAWNLGCAKKRGFTRSQDYYSRGLVLYPTADDIAAGPAGGHEFLVVGWDDTTAVPVLDVHGQPVVDANGNTVTETGFFIFKNSWGAQNFGSQNPYAPGFGLISQKYVDDFGGGDTTVADCVEDYGACLLPDACGVVDSTTCPGTRVDCGPLCWDATRAP